MISTFSLAIRLAVRELRGGLGGFYVLIICIMLGVMAITTVGVLSSALRAGLGEQGRVLLGGDISFSLVHQAPTAIQRNFISRFGHISEIATLRSIARPIEGRRTVLVDIKAVDKAYPLTGDVLVRHEGRLDWHLQQGNTALVDPLLLERLGIKIGDRFSLGEAKIRVTGTIAQEPDRLSGRLNFGPRVLMSRRTLLQTGLWQPGSLIRFDLRLLLNEQEGRGFEKIQSVIKEVKQQFPQAGFRIRDRSNPSPGIRRAIDRFAQFLMLVSLAALFIGGVGVANAVNSHIANKREVIATFKSLGASGRLIFLTYFVQIVMLAALGIALGLVLGLAFPSLLNLVIASALPVKLSFGLPLGILLLATIYGFLVALIFMLWPLGGARKIRAAELYRAQISLKGANPGWGIVMLTILLVLLLGATTVLTSHIRFVSLYACFGFSVVYFAFYGLAALFKWTIRRLPRPQNIQLAMARASLAGPTPLMRTIVMSLGIGLSLLVTVSLVQNSFVAELASGLPREAPNFFVLDIDKKDLSRFKKIAVDNAPGLRLNEAPMLRGRVTRLAGIPVENVNPAPNVEWVLRGDRGLTFADEIPKGSVLTKGSWWSKDYDGPPLVSFEEKIAKGLGLSLGDKVTVNVLGRDIEAEIANLRRVKWESLSINFVMIFSPNTLQNAPYKLLATLTLRDRNNVQEEARLISGLVSALPDITPIAVREALAAIDGVLQRILTAVRVANLVLLLVGAIALAGAMAATHNNRVRETVIFKVLGATRKRILTVHLIEYLLLAVLSAVIALLFGGAAAYAIVTYGMEMTFSFSWRVLLEIIVLVLVLILPLGLMGTWRILGQSSTKYLRQS
jgi:putative ABC transport system permease protein